MWFSVPFFGKLTLPIFYKSVNCSLNWVFQIMFIPLQDFWTRRQSIKLFVNNLADPQYKRKTLWGNRNWLMIPVMGCFTALFEQYIHSPWDEFGKKKTRKSTKTCARLTCLNGWICGKVPNSLWLPPPFSENQISIFDFSPLQISC